VKRCGDIGSESFPGGRRQFAFGLEGSLDRKREQVAARFDAGTLAARSLGRMKPSMIAMKA
jgi:hypothetical protein